MTAGTKIKVIFSKLVSLEKTAKKLFDKDMQTGSVYIDQAGKFVSSTKGVLLTADKIGEMAKSNLLETFELMSKLNNEGKLSTGTLQKMFTGRHFTEAQAVLRAVGGDWERFNRVFAQGVNYQQDYAKQMMNVNNEIAKLKNNLLAVGLGSGGSGSYLNTMISGTAIGFNEIAESSDNMAKSFFNVTSHAVGLGAQFAVLYKAISLAKAGLVALNPVLAVIAGGVTASIFAWQKHNVMVREAQIAVQSFLDLVSREGASDDKYSLLLDQTALSAKAFKEQLEEIRSGSFIISGLDETSFSMMGLIGHTEKLGEAILTVNTALNSIGTGVSKQDEALQIQKIEELEKKYKQSHSETSLGKQGYMKEIERGIVENLWEGGFEDEEVKAINEKIAKKIIDDVFKKADGTMSHEDFLKSIEEESKKYEGMQGFSFTEMRKVVSTKSVRDAMQKWADSADEERRIAEELAKEKDALEKTMTSKNDELRKINSEIGKMVLDNSKISIDMLKDYGKVTIGGKELFGQDAFESISIKSFGGDKEAEEKFKVLFAELKELNGFKLDFSSPEAIDYAVKSMSLLGNIKDLEADILELKAQQVAMEDPTFKQADIVAKESILSQAVERLNLMRTEKKYRDEKLASEKNTNEYTFKYKNYLKESLDIELERLKIGKTAGQQAVLEYEYKVKQLEVNKELADQELKSAKLMGQKSLGGLTDLSATRANLETLQAQRDALTSQTFQVGEAGKANKDKLTQLDAIMTAMVKVLDIEERIALAPLQEFNKLSDNFPKTLKTIIDSLSDSRLPNMNIWKDMLELQDVDLQEAIDKISKSFNKEITSGNIDTSIQDQVRNVLASKKKVQEAEKKGGKALSDATLEYVEQVELLNDMNDLKKDMLDKDKKMLEYYQQMNKPFQQIGGLFSTLGSVFGNDSLSSMGNIFTEFSDVNSKFQSGDFGLDFGSMFKNGKFDTQAMGKVMESASAMMSLGQMGGSLMAGIFGGNSQMGGELGSIGGLIGTMVGGPVGGMIGSALGGLAGGLFGGDSAKDQEKAQRKTNEANRLYQENTNALNKLANNMANLNSGIDSLNNSLLSSFSQIPTFDKLNNVTDALKEMNKTLLSSRDFGSIAYQITKSKKSGGGLFSKGQTVQWTETHEKTLQQMLNQYGFKGTIYDMDSGQLQNFAEWLEDVKLGEQSNVEGMAQLIKDYAEAMNKMEDNIDDFFYDATMEGFSGISSIAQEELKQQLTDFYKNLGITIDEEMQKEIDKLAEQMSVMVTIMADVRGEFLSVWRETGSSAGEAFVSSMKPYMDSLLGNISQIYYDVYFSDVTTALEDSFKKISEELVELKKQGADLNWDDVGGKLAGEFDKVLSAIISAKQESESFNDIIMQLQKQAIEAGLSLSELFELGLVSGTQSEVLEMFKDAVLSKDDDGALTAIGDFMGDKIGKALSEKLMDNLFSSQILEFSNQLDSVLSGELKFSQLAGLMSQANAIGIGMEQSRLQLEAILAGFDFSADINYTTDSSKVEYSAGTSQQNTYVYNISSAVNAGNLIESDSIQSLADELLDIIIEKLKVDKGIDITKNY